MNRLGVAQIENRILTIRGQHVMLDRDLAELYGVETKVLNQAVKRNLERFPQNFRFQLDPAERLELVTNCDRFNALKHSNSAPYVFTEQGVAMLSAVLRSETAVNTSIRIMEAFVAMRAFMVNNAALYQRIDKLELKQLRTEEQIDVLFDKLNQNNEVREGVFFDGQIFDAYFLIAELIKKAQSRIVIVDNYVDDSVLNQLTKRRKGVEVLIYGSNFSKVFRQDVARHNAQYPGVTLHNCKKAHDRFLIVDNEVYHIGASLKDLGKKLFAFSKMEILKAPELIAKLE